ncbi:MAG: lycopene cyclase [Deltaproteobacteria bacterium]|nr:lycopene cyclase [Deltaproteobacteria bacterium]
MSPEEARARVRDAAGPELLERLEHLDATRSRPPVDDRPPESAPDVSTAVDCDVALVGGGLSLLYAPVLAAMGAKVHVFDRSRAGGTHREWNASERELDALVSMGLLTHDELDGLIIARYREGFCRWHEGGTWPVTRVLDRSVDAGALLSLVRRRAESLGVVFHDGHSLIGHASGERSIALRFIDGAGASSEVVARLMIDARGAASPSATADLICPTVGGVLTGLAQGDGPAEVDPGVGEILVTTEGVEEGRQHIWEGFPGRPGETTVYLFYYDKRTAVGDGSLVKLYARFFETLPRYKRGEAKLERPTFGYIPGWSRLTPAPRPPSSRIVLVGDAAARHSPLTYCGFGATLRSVKSASARVMAALSEERVSLDPVVHDTPLHRGTGALAHMIASPPREPAKAGALNGLLDAAFGSLHSMGDEAYGRLLRDEMSGGDFFRFLHSTSMRRPEVYPWVFRVLGAAGVGRWGAGVLQALWSKEPVP